MNKKIWIKIIVFLGIFSLILLTFSEVFQVKSSYKLSEEGFYMEPEDSIDVLFMGSSYAHCAFNPQWLLEDYGLTSYNRGIASQRLWMTSIKFEEALKTQSPKALVLEAGVFFLEDEVPEEFVRYNLDPMKLSKYKLQMMSAIQTYGESSDYLSMFIPFFRFHGRWTDLSAQDYHYAYGEEIPDKKGFRCADASVAPPGDLVATYMNNVNEPLPEMTPAAKTAFEHIYALCQAHNVQLILINTPNLTWNYASHQGIEALQETYDFNYIDFNLFYQSIGFDWNIHTSDAGEHANISGARILTDYMGKYLTGGI